MSSKLKGKIEKAKKYAQQPHRVKFDNFTLTFKGEHHTYTVNFKDKEWHCSCPFFAQNKICSHIMALKQMLGEMLP
jgi:predicted nucleic acid-binding Zn finger protein